MATVKECVSNYNLGLETINGFLIECFGNRDFHIKVCLLFTDLCFFFSLSLKIKENKKALLFRMN